MGDGERESIEREVNAQLVRDILMAMCRKQGISTVSPFDPSEEARNYTLAQRLGIGSVFGIPDNEEHKIEVHFTGGPWDGQTGEFERITAPVFAAGHQIGNHYWLDTKSGNTPTYHWDGTEWAIAQ